MSPSRQWTTNWEGDLIIGTGHDSAIGTLVERATRYMMLLHLAWITTTVLVFTLVVSAFSAPAAAVIVGAQAVVFAISALRGPRNSPYGVLFAKLVAPRLGR